MSTIGLVLKKTKRSAYSPFFRAAVSMVASIFCGALLSGILQSKGRDGVQPPEETVVLTGDPQPSAQDLATFFSSTKVAFLGIAESVVPVVLMNPRGNETVFSRLNFRPTEFIKGSAGENSGAGTFDVLRWGGSYVRTAAGVEPVRVAVIAQRIQIGDVYFVAAASVDGYPSLDGRYVLNGDDTLIRLAGGQAQAIVSQSEWVTSVIAKGRAAMTTPGVIPDDATAFLTAVRAAATP